MRLRDRMRADVYGNLWISSNAPSGYAGVLCFTSKGKVIGRIRLPEVCATGSSCAQASRFTFYRSTPWARPPGVSPLYRGDCRHLK